MKIAFHLNCLVHGGAERVVSNLAGEFASHGHEVLVATEWVDQNEYPLDPRVKRVHVGLRPEDEKKGRLTKILLRRRYLREFMLQYRPDVLVSFAIKANYRALSACRGTGVPVVISVRIDPEAFYSGFVNHMMISLLFDRASGAVFQTPRAKAFFAPHVQDNSVIILNPITQKFIDAPDTPLSARTKTIVNVGRLVDFKDQALLVRAFKDVHSAYPDYDLKIYGPDSHDGTKELLERTIAECGLQSAVTLCGDCNTLEKTINTAAMFVFSSDYEGMPNALMEAMALGLPVIATDCPPGAPAMLIQEKKNGCLVPIKDEKALTEAMLYMIRHPEEAQAMGDAARKIREIANAQTIYAQWEEYLQRVIDGYRR